jgi:hypothetical protein
VVLGGDVKKALRSQQEGNFGGPKWCVLSLPFAFYAHLHCLVLKALKIEVWLPSGK